MWREFRKVVTLYWLYFRARRLNRAGRLNEARRLLLRLGDVFGDADGEHQVVSALKVPFMTVVPSLLASVSDKLERWDGEAEVLQAMWREIDRLTPGGANGDPWIREQFGWMEERLRWLEAREDPTRGRSH